MRTVVFVRIVRTKKAAHGLAVTKNLLTFIGIFRNWLAFAPVDIRHSLSAHKLAKPIQKGHMPASVGTKKKQRGSQLSWIV